METCAEGCGGTRRKVGTEEGRRSARKRETGVGVEKEREEEGGHTSRTEGEKSEKGGEREREGKKKGNERREAHGPCIEPCSQLLCSQGRSLPLKGRPKDVSLAISNSTLCFSRE